jgi:hypothetical protein
VQPPSELGFYGYRLVEFINVGGHFCSVIDGAHGVNLTYATVGYLFVELAVPVVPPVAGVTFGSLWTDSFDRPHTHMSAVGTG